VSYCLTLIRAGGETVPAMFKTTGTARSVVFGGSDPGSWTLICVTPAMSPGAAPDQTVTPATPLKVTIGVV